MPHRIRHSRATSARPGRPKSFFRKAYLAAKTNNGKVLLTLSSVVVCILSVYPNTGYFEFKNDRTFFVLPVKMVQCSLVFVCRLIPVFPANARKVTNMEQSRSVDAGHKH